MSAGCYVLARFSDLEKLSLAAHELEAVEDVVQWDAVEGHVQLVAKLRTPASGIPSALMTLPGVSDIIVHEILASGPARDRNGEQSAYVFIETTPEARAVVAAALAGHAAVASVDETEGGCDVVVVVTGVTFEAVDRFVAGTVNHIEGILRIKYNRVIDLIGL